MTERCLAGTPEGPIHTRSELKVETALITGTDLGFDQKERKILSELKTSYIGLNYL